MSRFTIRDLLWLAAVIGLIVAWWATRRTPPQRLGQTPSGPLSASQLADRLPSSRSAQAPEDATGGHTPKAASNDAVSAVAQFTGHTTPVRQIKLSPDGSHLLSFSGGAKKDTSLRLWNVVERRPLGTFTPLAG